MGKQVKIETTNDLNALLEWIDSITQNTNLDFYRVVFDTLFGDGKMPAVQIDVLVRLISNNRLWKIDPNEDVGVSAEDLRDRFARRIRWVNRDVLGRDDSPCRDTLFIVYDRGSSRYQIVTDRKQVQALRNRRSGRRVPGVAVEILSEELRQGEPSLEAGGELEFSVRSSITGFVHAFHADGNNEIDKLFPEPCSVESLKVAKGKELFFPDAISDLCTLKRWRIDPVGSTTVKQKLLVLVTEKNVAIGVSDVWEHFGIKTRGISREKTTLDDLTSRQKLSSIAEYWLKNS